MTRETLPNRRATIGYEFTHEGLSYMAHVSHFDDGRPAEIFITGAKVGTGVDSLARDASVAVSHALQRGMPLDQLRRGVQRDPQGAPLSPVGAALDMLEFA